MTFLGGKVERCLLLWCRTCRGRTQHGCSKYAAKKLSTTDSCSAADSDAEAEPTADASSVAHDDAVGPCWAYSNATSNSRTAAKPVRFSRIFIVSSGGNPSGSSLLPDDFRRVNRLYIIIQTVRAKTRCRRKNKTKQNNILLSIKTHKKQNKTRKNK